jgi:hypothetical protein
MRSTTKPALVRILRRRLPLTAGKAPPLMLGGYRDATDFGMCVGRDRDAVILPVREDRADRFLGVRESFLLIVALRDHLGKGRDKHGKTAALLGFKDDRENVVLCHGVAPVFRRVPRTGFA